MRSCDLSDRVFRPSPTTMQKFSKKYDIDISYFKEEGLTLVSAVRLLEHPDFRQPTLSIINDHLDRLYKQTQELSVSLHEVENPSLLDGLI